MTKIKRYFICRSRKKFSALLVGVVILCSSCAQKISLSKTCPEFLKESNSLIRCPIFANISVFSSQGSFNLFLQLNPALAEGELLGITPFGQTFFQVFFQEKNFLYLDLINEIAYSNQKDWLGENYLEINLPESLRQITFLLDLIQRLCGKFPSGRLECEKENQLWKIQIKEPDEDIRIYYFSGSGELKKIEYLVNKEKIKVWLDYEKSWFPSQIKISAHNFFLQAKTIKLQQNSEAPSKFPPKIPPDFSCYLLRESW